MSRKHAWIEHHVFIDINVLTASPLFSVLHYMHNVLGNIPGPSETYAACGIEDGP